MNKLTYISILFLVLSANNAIQAQSSPTINVVTTAVPSLRISSDARSNAMGSAGIAISPDVNAVYWNLGKLPFTETTGAISANYSPWLSEWASDMYLASVAGYFKLSRNEAIHGLIRYFNLGNIQFTDGNGNHLQSAHPNEFGINIGYSKKLSERLGVGLGIQYIRSNLANGTQNGVEFKASNALAADLGFFYDLRKEDKAGWSFGAALSNLGSKISYTKNGSQKNFLPANLGIGTSYTKVFDDQNNLSFALDINKLLVPTAPASGDSVALVSYRNKSVAGSWFSSFSDAPGGFSEELKEWQISIGAEYWYNNQFALRAGYFYEDKMKGDRKYFSTGAGIKFNVFTVNFSYLAQTGKGINKNPLSNTLQFGVIINIKD
jgi:hypothetical protein